MYLFIFTFYFFIQNKIQISNSNLANLLDIVMATANIKNASSNENSNDSNSIMNTEDEEVKKYWEYFLLLQKWYCLL